MVGTNLHGVTRARFRATVFGTLVSFIVAGCSGGRPGDDSTTTRSSAVTAVAPGAETPLSDLVSHVEQSNAKLAALFAALAGGEGMDDAADDVALLSARLANAADDAMDQADERELEQALAKQIEATAAASHGAAAAMIDAAGNALDTDDGANRVATFGAAVAGAHAAAANAADAAAGSAAGGEICGNKQGLKDALTSAIASMQSAKSAADGSASQANQYAAGTEGLLAQDALDMAAAALDSGPTASELAAALEAVKGALDQDASALASAIQNVKGKLAAHKTKIQTFADRVIKISQDGELDGKAEANAKGAKAGAGDADRKCAAARKDAMKKAASKKAALHTAGAAMAVAKKRHIKTRTAETRKKLAKVAEEANKAAGKGANGGSKLDEIADEIEEDIAAKRARKRKIKKVASAMHIVSAAVAHGAAKAMEEELAEDDIDTLSDMAATVASMHAAMDSLADAAGEVAENEVIESDLAEMLQMVTAASTSANTAMDTVAILAELLKESVADSDDELRDLIQALLDELRANGATRKIVSKTAGDAAKKYAIKGEDTTGAAGQMKGAATTDKARAKETADKAEKLAGKKDPGGSSESISKTAGGHASDAAEKCSGVRKDKLKKLVSSMAAAHTTKASLAAAKKKAAKQKTAEAKKKAAEAADEANKASAQLANMAAMVLEGVRDAEPDLAAADVFEGVSAAAHTFAAGLADVASEIMDEDIDDGFESIAELMASVASARTSSNRMMDLVADAIADETTASPDIGELLQVLASASVSSNVSTDLIADLAEMVQEVEESSAIVQALEDFKQSARNKQSRKEALKKTADAARKFSDATKDTTGAAGEMKGASQADKPQTKDTADKAAGAAGAVKPGGNSEAVSKTASAGASDAPSVCGSTKEDAFKKLSSSMAAAHTAASSMAAAHKKAQREKTVKALKKLAAMKAEVHKAASHLGNTAEMVMEAVSEIGLATDMKEQMEDAIAAAHAAAAAMSAAAAETVSDETAACGEAPISDLGAMLASMRVASNALAHSSADVATGTSPAMGMGHVLQMTTMSMVMASKTADNVADTADDIASKTEDTEKRQKLLELKQKAKDKQTAHEAAKKSADAAQKHSDATKNPAGAAGEMKQAAQADKPKTKETAAAAGGAAQKIAPNGSGESMSKIAEAGADDVSSKCGHVSKQGMKKLASAKAAAHTSAMNLIAAMKKKQKSKTADSHSKLAAAKAEAHKASSKLAIEASKAMEMVSELGGGSSAAALKKRKIQSAAAALHTMSAALAEAANKSRTDDDETCGEIRVSEFGALMASMRSASNTLTEASGEVVIDGIASKAAGSMMRMVATGATVSNKAVAEVGKVAHEAQRKEPDAGKADAYGKLKQAAEDKATSDLMAKKAAEVSGKYSSGTQDTTGAAADMKAAAQADKLKAKENGDKAAEAADVVDSTCYSAAIATNSAAAASDSPASCSGASKETIKKLASAMASAHTVGANLAAAHRKAAATKTSEAHSKLAAMKEEAHKAGMHLGNMAAKAVDEASALGLSPQIESLIHGAAASAHVSAMSLIHAASKTKADDSVKCDDGAGKGASDLGAMLGAHRVASNKLALASAEAISSESAASVDVGQMLQMTTISQAIAGTTAEHVSKLAEKEAAASSDAGRIAKLQALKQKADEKDEARASAKKSADASRKLSDQTKSPTGAAGEMKDAAQVDKPRTKGVADTAADSAGTLTPGENGEAIAKGASAGATDAPASCGGSVSNGLKKFAAALAAAELAAANLSAAMKKGAASKKADSVSKLHMAVVDAHKAAAHLGNTAAKTMETTSSLGLAPATVGKLETTLALAHTMAAGLANAGSVSKTEDDGICAGTPVSDLGALLASARMASNSMAETLGLTMASSPASSSGGEVMMMMMVSGAAANTNADEVAETTDVVAAKTTDQTKKDALAGLKAAAKDDVPAKEKTRKAGDAAKAHAGSGANPGSASTGLKDAATADKPKAKGVADAATNNSKTHAPGGNGEAVSKLSKAGAADLPPSPTPSAMQDHLKKLASAKAAADTAGAVKAKASGKAAKSKTAGSVAKKEAAAKEAHKASAHLAIMAQRTLELAADLGLPAVQMAHIENTVAASHAMAANLAQASGKIKTDDDSTCGDSSAAPELGGVASSARAASNALSLAITQVLGGASGSQSAGHLASLGGAAAVGANLTADNAGDMADIVADTLSDATLKGLLKAFKQTSADNATAKELGNKLADAAETFANGTGVSPATAVSNIAAAAAPDKLKAKTFADAAISTAAAAAPGSNTLALAKLVTPMVIGNPASGPAPTAAEVSEKKAASALAMGQTIGALQASAAAKFEASSSAASAEMLIGILGGAHAASGVMGNASSKAFDTAGSVGLSAGAVSQLEAALASHHTVATALGHAAAQHGAGDTAACGEKAKIADLGALLASAKGAVNGAAQSASQALTTASTQSGARLAVLTGVAAAGSNIIAERVVGAVDAASANTTDGGKLAAYASLKQAAVDRATADALANKAADAAQIFASGVGSKATAISDYAASATADKVKAKQAADVATASAGQLAIGSNAESLSKLASAGVTGSPASGTAANAFESALKKLASAMAAAQTAGANLAAAVARATGNTNSATIAKAAATVKAASSAAVTLSNVATAIGAAANTYGLSADLLAQLKLTLTAAQAAATNLSNAAAQASLAISGSCTSKGALAGLEGAISGAQTSASSLATTLTQALSGLAASGSRSRLSQMVGASLAGANTSTKNLGDAAQSAAATTTDAQLVAALNALLAATAGNATALTMTGKAANTAQTIAAGGNTAGVLADLNTAINGAGAFIANLGSLAGAAAAPNPTARIAQLSEPALWTASNGTLSKSPISVNGFNSISVAAGGYVPIVSAPMSSVDIRATAGPNLSKISYSLLIPTNAPNPFWVGATQMFLTAPSANMFNVYLGQIELTGQPLQTFIRPTFTVPPEAMSILTDNRNDVTITITINVNGGTQGWLLNDLRFGQ